MQQLSRAPEWDIRIDARLGLGIARAKRGSWSVIFVRVRIRLTHIDVRGHGRSDSLGQFDIDSEHLCKGTSIPQTPLCFSFAD
jgi:hypothetical protein